MFAQIAIFTPPFKTYTYSLPVCFSSRFWQPGLRVAVPIGNCVRAGCLLSLSESHGLPDGVECRPVFWPLEVSPLIDAAILALSLEMARRQAVQQGAIFGAILPARLKSPAFRIVSCRNGVKNVVNMKSLRQMPEEEKIRLARDLEYGAAIFARSDQAEADMEIYTLAAQPPWPIRPAARKQAQILDYLFQQGPLSRRKLLTVFGSAVGGPLRKLVGAGIVRLDHMAASETISSPWLFESRVPDYNLTDEQLNAIENLEEALLAPTAQTRLLYGVTGSGKTAIYLELAKKCLELGKSIMLLAPEVALAHKLYLDARGALGGADILLYHGYQHPIVREHVFRKVGGGEHGRIIVGTRSALFLPVRNLVCIILDEEHDASYKQEERLPYHAKEVAWERMQRENGLFVLGSATPDIRVFYASQNGSLPLLTLRQRATGATLPQISLSRILASRGLGGNPDEKGLLTEESEEALKNCVRKGEQAVILLNRRGYAPLVYCLACEKTIRCPNCQIGMAFHKGSKRLICHYCGYAIEWPAPCPECGDTAYIAIGEGTEKIAESLEAIAGAPVLRLDRDNARVAGQIENILESFSRGDSPFLVGTQMLSKGHHFPNVTLVVVADGDIGLNLPDYRAAEKTFQLLTQAAGRAGRGSKPGKAIIQTRNTDHYCWRHVVNHDYEGFYAAELALRRKYRYPPFIRLGLLRVSFDMDEKDGPAAVRDLGKALGAQAKKMEVQMLGPAPAPLPILNGRKRYQCLFKCDVWNPMRELWHYAQQHKSAKKLRIMLDLDPVNMM